MLALGVAWTSSQGLVAALMKLSSRTVTCGENFDPSEDHSSDLEDRAVPDTGSHTRDLGYEAPRLEYVFGPTRPIADWSRSVIRGSCRSTRPFRETYSE